MTEDEVNQVALAMREALVQTAYFQIAMEKGLTIQPAGPWGASTRALVPGHWRQEAEARAMPYVTAMVDVLSELEAS